MQKKWKRAIAVAAAATSALGVAALWPGIVVKQYTIETEQIQPGNRVKMVVVSDLHSAIFGKNQKNLIKKIEKEKPDLIVCAGDMVDDMEPQEGAWLFFSQAVDIAPTYYVSGNHEWWSGEMDEMKAHARQLGVHVLEEDWETLQLEAGTLVMGGVDDPVREAYDPGWSWNEAVQQTMNEMSEQQGVHVLLSHRPERWQAYAGYGIDVVVSGHAHGGQVRIPFLLNGLFAPDQGWIPSRAGGLYEDMDYAHVVCRGTGHTWRLPRVWNPPEMDVVQLVGTYKG